LKSSEDVSIETRDRLHALGKREQSRAVLDHGDTAEARRSRREEIAVCREPPPVDEGLARRLDLVAHRCIDHVVVVSARQMSPNATVK
jgi:hypothetical protein